MWSCQWKKRRMDPGVKQFVDELGITTPLNIKDEFNGGRTNAAKLYHKCEGQRKTLFCKKVTVDAILF